MTEPVVVVTGGALRIGATICETLHGRGYRVVIHCLNSLSAANNLARKLNIIREHSACVLSANLNNSGHIEQLAADATAQWGRVDALVNSASRFYPTPVGSMEAAQFDDLIASNAKAPLLLAQALAPALAAAHGAIVNIADIYGDRPLNEHAAYSMAKAANQMLTKSLALELAPAIRVNGVSPGAILWPQLGGAADQAAQQLLLNKVPLARIGNPKDIAEAVAFLLQAPYITGQILAVDGGRSLHM